MIGKGAVRGSRDSFHTLTIVKLSGVVVPNFSHSRACKKCKTVKTLIGRWWREG